MKKTNIILICGLLIFVLACGLLDRASKTGENTKEKSEETVDENSNKKGADLDSVFADMEKGLKDGDEDLFKKHWDSRAYKENFVGGSGLPGEEVFRQGTGKKWFPKPDLTQTEKVGSVVIVPAQIWSWEQEKSLDKVYFAVQTKDKPVILGGGERMEEVRKLAERADKGEPLTVQE